MKDKGQIESQILKLQEKYKDSGQDISSYLDGLLYQRYLTYWDYIHLDTLLSLQVPRTHFPDEEIFIMYHQITELYFKLILHEEKQIVDDKSQKESNFYRKTQPDQQLLQSLDILFQHYGPWNGAQSNFFITEWLFFPQADFQSAQYRMIEIYATSLEQLVHASDANKFSSQNTIENLYENMYWKKGATDMTTGEKTLTLKQFE